MLPFPAPAWAPRLREVSRRKAAFLRAVRGIAIRRPVVALPRNPDRRARCRGSLLDFGRSYFPAFDWDSRFLSEYLGELQGAALLQGPISYQKALAAPRSIGKTTAALIFLLWALLYRHVRFVAILSSSGPEAQKRMGSILSWVLRSDLLNEDFPEITGPVRACEGEPRLARMAGFFWSGDFATFANGAICLSGGLEGPVRGMNYLGYRPDLVLLDDIESEDSVYSRAESEHLSRRFRNEVMGMADKRSRSIFLYLCTIIRKGCISDSVTDQAKEPEWRGRRWRGLEVEPERGDLWETYQDLCRGDQALPDEFCQISLEAISAALGLRLQIVQAFVPAHQDALRYYLANRDLMDRGAQVLDAKQRPLHDLYHERATKGEHYYRCEIQQDPPAEEASQTKGLEVAYLRNRQAQEPAGVAPAWAEFLIASIDVGQYRLHWEIDAWSADLTTSQLVECGIEETGIRDGGRLDLTDGDAARAILVCQGIRAAFGRLRARFDQPVARADGKEVRIRIRVTDCGGAAKVSRERSFAWMGEVIKICSGFGPEWHPVRGVPWTQKHGERAGGRNWLIEKTNNPGGRVDANADFYKGDLMEAYLASPVDGDGKLAQGARMLHAATPTEYLRHQTAEKMIETVSEGKPVARAFGSSWVLRPREEGGHRQNHWWDTGWMQYLAADLLRTKLGVRRRRAGVVGKAFGG